MEPIKISDRLKYYRNILDIGQKALVDENISINIIKYVEGGKRKLTIHKAMILADKLNTIAREKKVELNVTTKDLLSTDKEYALKICLDELNKIDEKIYEEEKYNEILGIAQDYNLDEVIIDVYEKIGKYYHSIRDFNNSLKYNEKALDLAVKIDKHDKKVKILNSLGVSFYMKEDYVKALEIYAECYTLLINANLMDSKLESKVLYNLALCNKKLKRNSETQKYLDKLLAMRDFEETAVINGMIVKANLFLENEDYEGALQLYKVISTYGSEYMYIIQNNMAYAFLKLNRVQESIEYLTKSITEQLEKPDPILTLLLMNMGITYIDEKLYNPAASVYEYAINNAIKFHQLDLIPECCENLFMLYDKTDKVSKFHEVIAKITAFKNNNTLTENQLEHLNKLIEDYSKYIKV